MKLVTKTRPSPGSTWQVVEVGGFWQVEDEIAEQEARNENADFGARRAETCQATAGFQTVEMGMGQN